MKELFSEISEQWFLTEPLLFSVLCTHKLVEKTKGLPIPMRIGKMKIEYNPEILKDYSNQEIEEFLKFEVIRIILKHPYQRKPFNAHYGLLSSSSNFTILENYNSYLYCRPSKVGFPPNLSFEEYYKLGLDLIENGKLEEQENEKLDKLLPQGSEELSALWDEDDLQQQVINDMIKQVQETNFWGNLSGNLVSIIKASLVIKMDYRKILNSFRASVIASKRNLTRMRPSRRYGFQSMGSKSDFTTKLLVAIDVSGSVSDKDLQNFLSVTNSFFKYGIKEIDVIQFDTEIKGDVMSLKKAQKTMKIKGRGGTCFQPIDYICEHKSYDGLLIFTDGGASKPILKQKINTKILWVLDTESNYNMSKEWIEEIPKSRAVWIP